ncbi:MAG: DUF3391 domain-containing protein [Nitrospira sp.]|nr:DUF3391 domain-containing protein [Nitrospira sp.]
MATKQIPVHELQVGMYVTKLDVSWIRSPFLRHSFRIEQTAQIERLVRTGVQTVEIDPDQSITIGQAEDSRNTDLHTDRQSQQVQILAPKQIKPLAQLNEEHAQAVLAKKQLDRAVHSLYTAIAQTGTVHPEQAAEAVQEITIVARTLPNSALFMALSQHRGGDASLTQHALSTCTLALMLGQALRLNPLELQELATAALLHDIGLLQVPTSIIHRAHATSPPLSEDERRQFRAHSRFGVDTLKQQGGFDTTIPYLIEHHHPADTIDTVIGATPPQSLLDRTGILALADKYDELITGFGGATPYGPQQAIQRLYIDAQRYGLNKNILAQFISIVGIYPVHSHVKLNTNETAVVTALNVRKLHQPIVTITHNTEGTECREPLIIDLAHQEDQDHHRAIALVLDDRALPEPFQLPHAA